MRCYLLLMCLVCIGANASILADNMKETRSVDIPLHDRIDAFVEQEAIGALAPLCSDADFLRRVHLDLSGTIPTVEQVRHFLDDSSPQKRQTVIDQLILSEDFSRHMAVVFDVMLLERRSDKAISVREWERYLIDSIASNKPLDQLFQELIYCEDDQGTARTPTKFILNRDAEPNAVTRDVGRIAFGMDLQCAQCHNHRWSMTICKKNTTVYMPTCIEFDCLWNPRRKPSRFRKWPMARRVSNRFSLAMQVTVQCREFPGESHSLRSLL